MRGLVVRGGAVRAARDDGEERDVVALDHEAVGDLAGDVRLGTPDEPSGDDPLEGPVRGAGRGAQARHLLGILPAAHRPDHVRGDPEGRVRQGGLEAQQEGGAETVRDEKASVPGVGAAETRCDDRERVLALRPGHEVERLDGDASGARGGRRLEAGHDERGAPVRGHDEQVQPLETSRRVPDEPLELRADPDERGGRSCAVEAVGEQLDALGMARGGDARVHPRASVSGR
jgi:hypothetical protein